MSYSKRFVRLFFRCCSLGILIYFLVSPLVIYFLRVNKIPLEGQELIENQSIFGCVGLLHQRLDQSIEHNEKIITKLKRRLFPLTLFTVLHDWEYYESEEGVGDQMEQSCLRLSNSINSILSWRHLRISKIILFGSQETCSNFDSLGLFTSNFITISCLEIPCFHEDSDIPRVDCIFEKVTQLSTTGLIAYVNSDIVLERNFLKATAFLSKKIDDFLMVGRRIDVHYPKLLDFTTDWVEELSQQNPTLHGGYGIDYFVFRTKYSPTLPPFLVGRVLWDNWLLTKYINSFYSEAIDATNIVNAFHLEHFGQSHLKLGTDYNKNITEDYVKSIGSIDLTDLVLYQHPTSSYILKRNLVTSFKILTKKFPKNNFLIISSIKNGEYRMATNIYCKMKRMGINNFLFHTPYYQVARDMAHSNFPTFFFQSKHTLEFLPPSQELKNIKTILRTAHGQNYSNIQEIPPIIFDFTTFELVHQVLKHGIDVLICDPKLIFQKDPAQYLKSDFTFQGTVDENQSFSKGFFVIKANSSGLSKWKKVLVSVFNKLKSLIKENPNILSTLSPSIFLESLNEFSPLSDNSVGRIDQLKDDSFLYNEVLDVDSKSVKLKCSKL